MVCVEMTRLGTTRVSSERQLRPLHIQAQK
jgi:hypothetical protein